MAANMTFMLDTDMGVLVARRGSDLCWPILEYDKIGEGGNFQKEFTFELRVMDVSSLHGQRQCRRVSRNKVPQEMKDLFGRAFAGERIVGIPRHGIGVS